MLMKEERNLHHCVCPQEITWQLLFTKSVSILYVDLRHIYECTCDTDVIHETRTFAYLNTITLTGLKVALRGNTDVQGTRLLEQFMLY